MNNLIIWIIIGVWSVALSLIKYYSANVREKEKSKIFIFNEIWNHLIAIFIGGSIIYYLIAIRYPRIIVEGEGNTMDLILLLVLVTCLLGWTPYFIKNITEGINAIIVKALK